MKKVSILIPAYNEGESLPQLMNALDSFIASRPDYDWEVLFVNDGSTDDSLEQMRRKHERDRRFRYVDLSRNFGKENAMHAGFDHVTGDCTVIVDADLQYPIEVIPEMLEKWEQGYDDVYGRRLERGRESKLRRSLTMTYYRLLERLADRKQDVLPNVSDFRLLDSSCIEAIRSMPETQRYTKGMYSYIGFRKTPVDFVQRDRIAGVSKHKYGKLFALAVEGVTSQSVKPLRVATIVGFAAALFAMLYLVYIVLKTLIVGEPIAGFPTLMVTILFLGGCQLMSVGLIGEYLGRVFKETKNRPDYFIREVDGERYRVSRDN